MDEGLKVVGETEDGRQTVALTKKLQPDVVLMDIAMPLLNGLEATRQILALEKPPVPRVLVLSAYGDDEYVRRATESGAAGFLLKQTSAHEVCRAIREVHQGKTFFTPSVCRRINRLKSHASKTGAYGKSFLELTSREVEVLQLIAEGKANKQTAVELDISIKTVEKHREHLMAKLDIHDTAGLTRYAIAMGIIESTVQTTIT